MSIQIIDPSNKFFYFVCWHTAKMHVRKDDTPHLFKKIRNTCKKTAY